jgi:hypothetical protein
VSITAASQQHGEVRKVLCNVVVGFTEHGHLDSWSIELWVKINPSAKLPCPRLLHGKAAGLDSKLLKIGPPTAVRSAAKFENHVQKAEV